MVKWSDSVPADSDADWVSSDSISRSLTHRLHEYFLAWSGTPYAYGGSSRAGIDCSAYVQQVAQSIAHMKLPRTTREQMSVGVSIDRGHIRAGDLVFFDTGPSSYHVGILMDVSSFTHASQSHGVTISRLDDHYWRDRIIGFRRVFIQSR